MIYWNTEIFFLALYLDRVLHVSELFKLSCLVVAINHFERQNSQHRLDHVHSACGHIRPSTLGH